MAKIKNELNINIGDKYVIEGGMSDFILYALNVVEEGKNAGQLSKQRIGYYSKIEHLIRALINHDIRTGEAQSLQEIQQQITRISSWCENSFKEAV